MMIITKSNKLLIFPTAEGFYVL